MYRFLDRFSPDGKYLAVGAHEGTVDFYDMSKGASLQRVSYCKGIEGFVMMLDFSSDNKYVKVRNDCVTSHSNMSEVFKPCHDIESVVLR